MNSLQQLPDDCSDLGAYLRNARMESGSSLADVERQTRIKAAVLERLEKNHYGPILSGSYALSFLKQYARHLNLDLVPFREVLPSGDPFYNLASCGYLRKPDDYVGSNGDGAGRARPKRRRTGENRKREFRATGMSSLVPVLFAVLVLTTGLRGYLLIEQKLDSEASSASTTAIAQTSAATLAPYTGARPDLDRPSANAASPPATEFPIAANTLSPSGTTTPIAFSSDDQIASYPPRAIIIEE